MTFDAAWETSNGLVDDQRVCARREEASFGFINSVKVVGMAGFETGGFIFKGSKIGKL